MKFGVVVFPGSNCDDDMLHVLGDVLQQPVEKIWHKDRRLDGYGPGDCIVLPGGFAYGDYVRAGAIARFADIMPAVEAFARNGGYVFGICNGFQVLCETGLLPGALLRNADQKFQCKNVWIKPATRNSPLTRQLDPTRPLKIPVANAEGRYYADAATLDRLEENDQILFRYCDPAGNVNEAGNPNGAARNIAGVCNEARNVFGMMPHPERASEAVLGNSDGLGIFESLLNLVR